MILTAFRECRGCGGFWSPTSGAPGASLDVCPVCVEKIRRRALEPAQEEPRVDGLIAAVIVVSSLVLAIGSVLYELTRALR
jgi:hypothetical protein